MKKIIIFFTFYISFSSVFAEFQEPEFTHLSDTLNPEKAFEPNEEQMHIQDALREKAEENYKDSVLFKNSRREKYLTNAGDLSDRTKAFLVNHAKPETATQADLDRLNQEIAREKKRSGKLWFNGDRSGTLIKDLEKTRDNLTKNLKAKIVFPEKSELNFDNVTKTENLKPTAPKSLDVGSKIEDNPLKPKQNFDYDTWKKELEDKKSKIEDEQKEINKSITRLKKQEDYQKGQLSGIEYQKNEILKEFSKKTFEPEHIDYISTEIVNYQAEAHRIEQERLKDFKFTTFGIHDDNEKLQEIKKDIEIWKKELDAYDQLQELQEREKTINEKISGLAKQKTEHFNTLKAFEDHLHEINSSINNANFHLKRIDKYLNEL